MVGGISTTARTEVLGSIRDRYTGASKRDKSRMLDEFVALTGCHRKHAVRLMGRSEEEAGHGAPRGKRIYDEAVKQALIVVWEAADRICGKRLKAISSVFPVPIRGIDSDNDSVFINETLVEYCGDRDIEFTRSQAYRKYDQAWIEQKNGSVIRRFVGHERYSRLAAGQTLANLYGAVRLYVNYYQPSFQLLTKNRNAGSVTKRYSKPATPCDRLLDRDDVSEEIKHRLRKSRSELDPVSLLHSIRESQSALAAVSSPESGAIPDGESLEDFLSQLPDMWRRGEVRPTHARRAGGLAHGGHVPTRSREYGVRYSTGSSSSRTQLLLTCLII